MIRPVYFDDDEAIANGWQPLQEEALKITGQTREQLAKAPLLETVWKDFVYFADQFKIGNNVWGMPIMCGYNNVGYDSFIIDRLSKMFGQFDEENGQSKLFHPIHKMDVMHDIWRWTYGIKINPSNSISNDNVRKWMGCSEDKAHNALKDCLDGVFMMKKFINLYGFFTPKIKFKDSFANENKEIAEIMRNYGE